MKAVLATFLTLSTISSVRQLDWCEYWRYLQKDHLRPECNGIYRLRFANRKDPTIQNLPPLHGHFAYGFRRYQKQRDSMTTFTKKVLGIGTCIADYRNCHDSSLCDSQTICVSNSGYCCTKKLSVKCPPPDTLHRRCSRSDANWCSSNSHCPLSKANQCCPTSCGYNICI